MSMHVMMTFRGGPLDGNHEFTDNGRVRIGGNIDAKIVIARMIYDLTDKGQVGSMSQGFTPEVFKLLKRAEISEDLTGHKYLITKRTEDPIANAVSIVAEHIPPSS